MCEITPKKRLYCNERQREVEFDVVVEVYRRGATEPYLFAIFECKNYSGSVPETEVTEFSDKLSSIARNGAKGVLVVSSTLQSGAKQLAKSRNIGVAKFSAAGIEFVAERRNRAAAERYLFGSKPKRKELKFSAFYDGSYYGCIADLISGLDGHTQLPDGHAESQASSAPYLTRKQLAEEARKLHEEIGYSEGLVDLNAACDHLDVRLVHREPTDADLLGSADFKAREIRVFPDTNGRRQRFTIAHELGHFWLSHDRYLRCDSVFDDDVIHEDQGEKTRLYDRLEYQANEFASSLLLPYECFDRQLAKWRATLGIIDRGFGYVFVDDQIDNLRTFHELLGVLSTYFDVSKQMITVTMTKRGLLNDQRKLPQAPMKRIFLALRPTSRNGSSPQGRG
ncbi:MAG: ImmA/IrrE family metallo-endopeptidase [Pseudomonadota bacterium]